MVHYIEGCSAPVFLKDKYSLHASVVEIFLEKGAEVRYTTVQNWSTNVYNLVTQRALLKENASIVWVGGNLGSKITMKYPGAILKGKGANAKVLSFSLADKGQIQDSGGKAIHLSENTSSEIISKSISQNGGIGVFRSLAKIVRGAKNSRTYMSCDTLILDNKSRADTYPVIKAAEKDIQASHEATIGKIGKDQLFYLRTRGFSEDEAKMIIVTGFLEPILHQIPVEYAVELNNLISMKIKGI